MFERFARAARIAVEDARYEAERRGDRRIGSDHLLLALLQDDELAQLVGVDAAAAHDAADQLDRTGAEKPNGQNNTEDGGGQVHKHLLVDMVSTGGVPPDVVRWPHPSRRWLLTSRRHQSSTVSLCAV